MDFVLIRVDDYYVIRKRSEVDCAKHCPVYGGDYKDCRDKARELNNVFRECEKRNCESICEESENA